MGKSITLNLKNRKKYRTNQMTLKKNKKIYYKHQKENHHWNLVITS